VRGKSEGKERKKASEGERKGKGGKRNGKGRERRIGEGKGFAGPM